MTASFPYDEPGVGAPLTAVEAFRVRLPLVHEFETSSHRKSYLEHVLVRLEDADGATGLGRDRLAERARSTRPRPSTPAGSMLAHHLAPVGAGPPLGRARAGRPRAGHESAGTSSPRPVSTSPCWDLPAGARACRWPRRWAARAARVVAGVSLGIEPTVDDLLAQVGTSTSSGYPRVKLKIAPGWDTEPVTRRTRRVSPTSPCRSTRTAPTPRTQPTCTRCARSTTTGWS